jgi:hypothetical protein
MAVVMAAIRWTATQTVLSVLAVVIIIVLIVLMSTKKPGPGVASKPEVPLEEGISEGATEVEEPEEGEGQA